MKNIAIFLLLSLLFSSCGLFTYAPVSSSPSRGPQAGMPSEPGKCYAKSVIQDKYINTSNEFAVYTGTKPDDGVVLDTVKYEVAAEGTKWVKKKEDKNCLSYNPEDCLVWCLIEIPPQYQIIVVVKDTTLTDDFEVRSFDKKVIGKQGGFTEWREVICETNRNEAFKTQVQEKLKSLGYYNGAIFGEIDRATLDALIKYQNDNYLPVG